MKLFTDALRSGHKKREPRETLWTFLDRSGRDEVGPVRDLMEDWFAAYPDTEREQLRKRLTARADEHFHGAFFELYLFTLLRVMGFVAKVPKASAGEKTEDFKVYCGDDIAFRLEAKYAGPENEHAWQDAFQQEVQHALQQVASSRVWFSVRVCGTFEKQPRLKTITKSFKKWYDANSSQVLQSLEQHVPRGPLPTFEIEEAGVRLEVCPLALKQPHLDSENSIGLWSSGARCMHAGDKLRKALKTKASRYGTMGCPFILAVSMYEMADDIDIHNALFGHEVFTIRTGIYGPVGSPVQSRKPDGFWLGPRGQQNTRVSAVLLVRELFPWSVPRCTPIIYHNPWAERPLRTDLLPLAQMVPDPAAGGYNKQNGTPVCTLLGLPGCWPSAETARQR